MTELHTCVHCGKPLRSHARFCSACGQPVWVVKKADLNADRNVLLRAGAFMFVTISILAVHRFHILAHDIFNQYLIIEVLMALATIVFAIIYDNNWISGYRLPKWRPLLTSLLFVGSIVFALFVHYSTDYINALLDAPAPTNILDLYADSSQPLVMSILFWAIVPAVFEEMAFRGFLFYDLLGNFRARSTIIITSILFTLSHFSLLSVYWLFPFALFLGYMRLRYRTLWYSMFVHFCHNMVVILLNYREWIA